MKYGARGLFGRLAVGLVITSVLAIVVASAFLYVRFHLVESRFREGTLRSFANGIAVDLAANRGHELAVRARTAAMIRRAGGAYAILDAEGRWLAGSSPDREAFMSVGSGGHTFFELPAGVQAGSGAVPRYGVTLGLKDAAPAAYVQVVFPSGEIVFDSVLEEFLKDIAWLWLPFLLLILLVNLAVAHVALRPIRVAVAQARAIDARSTAVRIEDEGLPADVQALVRAVNLAFGRLRESYRTLEEFVSDIAHDLRTPLAVIKLQIASDERQGIRDLEQEFGRIERLVEQLLDRVRIGRIRLAPDDRVDIGALCRAVAGSMAPLVVRRGRSIELVGPEYPVMVVGIHDDLFRALRNLVENALFHAPEGSTITLAVDARHAVRVTDDGRGFPDHLVGHDFVDGPPVRSDRLDGAGLGLSIVARTLNAFGGRLELANHPTRGAVVAMLFRPAATAAVPR